MKVCAGFKLWLLWEHLNCGGLLNHQDASSKAMIHYTKSHCSHMTQPRFTKELKNISERKCTIFVFCSVVSAEIDKTWGKQVLTMFTSTNLILQQFLILLLSTFSFAVLLFLYRNSLNRDM